MQKIPGFVDARTRDADSKSTWSASRSVSDPRNSSDAAELTLFLLDQDGPEPDDTERARKRGLHMGKQSRDGDDPHQRPPDPRSMGDLGGDLRQVRRPGMCNPDDPEPCTSGTPSQAQIDNDDRSLAQRQHDALLAVGRIALMSGQLGQLNGLPVSVIIRTTLQDLESRAGIGVTGGGTLLPIAEVIRMAAHANHYLAVFDKATGSALNLFRTRRIASPAQRIMLIARDGGCTKPCCTVGAYGSQVHHAAKDWADGGTPTSTNSAWPADPTTAWSGSAAGPPASTPAEVEWTPPPHLDTGQTRVNNYHRPERLLTTTRRRNPTNPSPPNLTPTHHNRMQPRTQV